MLNWAIDSLPIGRTLCESWDYSALQLHSLTSTSIRRANELGLAAIDFEGNSWFVRVDDRWRWSDGTAVTGMNLLEGFKRLFRSNSRIMASLFSALDSVHASKNLLRFELKKEDPAFGELLELPNLAADSRAGLSTGPCVPASARKGSWIFKLNPHWAGIPISVKVRHVQDPEANVTFFQNGQLDCTADTAFPFRREREFSRDVLVADTGLEFVLLLNPGLAAKDVIRQIIVEAAPRIERCIRAGDEARWRGAPAKSRCASLSLAYDRFYPNREICDALGDALQTAGFPTVLVEDDYYRPSQPYDLRLIVTRGPHFKPSVRDRLAKRHANRIPLFKYPSIRLDRFPESNLFTRLLEVRP